jgi:PAS domain S-box-containing protein
LSVTSIKEADEDLLVRVLHVDDDSRFMKSSKQILEEQGLFQVDSAVSVEEAMKKLKKTTFDVVVSDYQMPEKDGLEFLEELRARGNNIPFILFTGRGREEVAIKALNLGADFYINKIGHPETVYSQLSHSIIQAAKKRKAEERLRYKVVFESTIGHISSRFVNLSDLDMAINKSLADIGKISGASRAYMFLLRKNGDTIDNTHEWCAEGVTPQIENLKNLPTTMTPWWMKQLCDNNIIHITDVSLMSAEAKAEKEILENQDIRSLMVLPLIVSGELAGFIGFDNVMETGAWSSDNVALLKIVAEVIGTALEHKRAEEKYRKQFEEALDAIFVADAENGILVDCNRAATKLIGRTKSEIIGKHQRTLHPSEESVEKVSRTFHQYLQEKKGKILEAQVVTKTGELKDVAIKANVIDLEDKKLIQGIFRDITEQKKTEEKLDRTIKELATNNEKIDVIGKLTRHDVQNKLGVILNNIYLAKQTLTDDHEALKYLRDVDLTCDQIQKIFDFASAYGQLGTQELTYIDLSPSFEEAAILFSGMNGVKFMNECHSLNVLADSLLKQLFYNLIDNSLKHGENVSQIRVYFKEEKDQLKLVYEDDGVGVPETEKELIFKEGYGKGTGYGLSLIRKICEAYGWTIQETGEQSKGSKFTIIIPKTNKNGKRTYKLS